MDPKTADIIWVDSDMTDSAMSHAQAYLDEHEGEDQYTWTDDDGEQNRPCVSIRRPNQGEACGTYQVWAGSLYHMQPQHQPEPLQLLTNRAWEHGCQAAE